MGWRGKGGKRGAITTLKIFDFESVGRKTSGSVCGTKKHHISLEKTWKTSDSQKTELGISLEIEGISDIYFTPTFKQKPLLSSRCCVFTAGCYSLLIVYQQQIQPITKTIQWK